MKRRIALYLVFSMIVVMLMGMVTASADSYKINVVNIMYRDYYTGASISTYILPSTVELVEGETLNPVGYDNSYYNLISSSPAYVTFDPAIYNQAMTVYVSPKTSATTTVSNFLTGQNINLGFYGDAIDSKIEIANPIPTIPVYQSVSITSQNLGGLLPTNTRLYFSTTNMSIASVSGTSINGNDVGSCKLLVYYNNSLLLSKNIVVAALTDLTPTPTIANTASGLSIGPAYINALKGKCYRFKNTKLNGTAISPSTLKWKSSNTKIATVSKTGIVKTRKAGTVVITAITIDGINSDSIEFIIK